MVRKTHARPTSVSIHMVSVTSKACNHAPTFQPQQNAMRAWSLMMVCSAPSMGGTVGRPPTATKILLACSSSLQIH